MENITIGQIYEIMLFLATFVGTAIILYNYIKKWLKETLKEEFKEVKEDVKKIGISNCKNYLVSCFSKIECGQALDESERERLFETYDEYTKIYKQNSYIHSKFEKLKKEGKI